MDCRLGPVQEIEAAKPARKLNVRRALVQRREVRYKIAGVIRVSYKAMTIVMR
jgi:hypothetical protein